MNQTKCDICGNTQDKSKIGGLQADKDSSEHRNHAEERLEVRIFGIKISSPFIKVIYTIKWYGNKTFMNRVDGYEKGAWTSTYKIDLCDDCSGSFAAFINGRGTFVPNDELEHIKKLIEKTERE